MSSNRHLRAAMGVALIAGACATGNAAQPEQTAALPTTTSTSTTSIVVATTSPGTTSTSTTTTVPRESVTPLERERLVIHAVGDVNFANTEGSVFGRHGFEIAFSGVNGIFQRDDLTLVNLECDPSELGTPLSSKPFSLRCDLASLPVMVAAGVDVAIMANNHSADYGFESLIDGRANLEAAGLNPVGAGADLAQANAARFFEVGGWTIAVVAFSGVSGLGYSGQYPKSRDLINPWFAEVNSPGVARASVANMTAVVSALDPVVDIVIVSIHQGEMNDSGRPDALERERGQAVVEAGADAVVIHHHHRLLPFEYFQGVPIFWGMGNFVWSRLGDIRDVTAVAEIVVEPDGTITGRLIPAHIESSGHPVLRGLPDPAVRSDRDRLAG